MKTFHFCTVSPPPPHPSPTSSSSSSLLPLCLFVYVCFWWGCWCRPICLISSARKRQRKPRNQLACSFSLGLVPLWTMCAKIFRFSTWIFRSRFHKTMQIWGYKSRLLAAKWESIQRQNVLEKYVHLLPCTYWNNFTTNAHFAAKQVKQIRGRLYLMGLHESTKGSSAKPQLNWAKECEKKTSLAPPPLSSCLEKTRWQ